MKKKNLLFTFDYELFLGRKSGKANRCVIEPTNKLLEIFTAFGVKAVFFVDTTWLLRLKETAISYVLAKKDYEKVVEQLRHISGLGHYIFPHLHPHWNAARYISETNEWQLTNYSKYRFHNLDAEEREKTFKGSITILKEIIGLNYNALGYRAGGWSIQPFEDFEPFFKRYGIKYDFSVLPGAKHISTGQHYDFSDVASTQPYLFSNDVSIPGKGDFMEFPISTIQIPANKKFLSKILLKYLSLSGYLSYGDGQGIIVETVEQIKGNKEMVSLELLDAVKLPLYLNFIEKNSYMQFIAHPKMLTDHNIKIFIKFLQKVLRKHVIETDLIQIAEINKSDI